MLCYGKKVKQGVNLGTRESFADISATVLEYLGCPQEDTYGSSFLSQIQQ
jgi:phosphopentomutase